VVAANAAEAPPGAADRDPEAAAWGGDAASWERTFARMPWGVIAIDEEFIAEQQHAADVLLAAAWLERPARVIDAVVPKLRELVERAVAGARAQGPPALSG
jgi:sulfonate transport system substrate-binding protein